MLSQTRAAVPRSYDEGILVSRARAPVMATAMFGA